MAKSWSMFTVSLDYSDIHGVITQGGGIVTTNRDAMREVTGSKPRPGSSCNGSCSVNGLERNLVT
jgi:hypothetical protein